MGRSRYEQRTYQVGDFWLDRLARSPAWQICWLDREVGYVRRLSTGTADLEQAKTAIRAHELKHGTPDLQPTADTTMAEVVLRYYEQHGQHTPARRWLKHAANHWVRFHEAATVDEACKPAAVQRFTDHLRGRGLKPSYIQNILSAGKAAVSRAWKRGELSRQPHIGGIKVGKTAPKGRPCSPEELAAYLDAAPVHLRPLIVICIGTASRPQAVAQLTWEQVDFQDELIHLNPEGREQTSKHRPVVKMPPALRAYLERLPRQSEHVISFRGKPVKRYQESLQKGRDTAGLDGRINMYSPRHSAARWMRKQGVPPWEINAQLGHKMARGMEMTELYAAYAPDYQAKATAALDTLLQAVFAASGAVTVHAPGKAKRQQGDRGTWNTCTRWSGSPTSTGP